MFFIMLFPLVVADSCWVPLVRNYAQTVPFQKVSTPVNYVKLQYFTQCPFVSWTRRSRRSIMTTDNKVVRGFPRGVVDNMELYHNAYHKEPLLSFSK